MLIDDNLGNVVFSGMTPLRVEMIYFNDQFDVTALCDEFENVKGIKPPLYLVDVVGEQIGVGRIGAWRRVISKIDPAGAQAITPEPYGEPRSEFDFKLKAYPNPMRDDGLFVSEDKEITPYPGITTVDGKPCYPSVPSTLFKFRQQFPAKFAEELVRRWNAFDTPTSSKGFGR